MYYGIIISARGAAKDLGLSHTAVLKKIHRHGLKDYLKTGRAGLC
ncbi:MAG: hypothetical protein KGZ32_02715 [Dethiobacter sp.]|nr:hypothetical protein [Dethiobacter sp.]